MMAEYGLYGAMVRHCIPLPESILQSARQGAADSDAPWLLGESPEAVRFGRVRKCRRQNRAFCPSGMHKKSAETPEAEQRGGAATPEKAAAAAGPEEKERRDGGEDQLRVHSIAVLRAKAQEHGAKMLDARRRKAEDRTDHGKGFGGT